MKYIILFFGVLLVPSLSVAQGGVAFSLTPDRGSWSENENFSVRVTLDAAEPITSLQASVLYDASRLTLVNVEKQESAFPYWWKNGFTPGSTAGEIMLQASAPTPGVQGNDLSLATLHFRAKSSGLAALLISQKSLALTSNDTNILNPSGSGAIFAVGSVFPVSPTSSFARNLQMGIQGADVKDLQRFLNAQGFLVATDGAGSPGQETDYFGSLTEAALIRFQEANAAQILAPLGLDKGTGFFGSSTRAYINRLR